ncbi:MAG: hypothetical protein ACE5HQ_07615 [Gemmatimonadota bacterium]
MRGFSLRGTAGRRGACLAVAAFLASACGGDVAGPASSFDPQATARSVAQVQAAGNNPALIQLNLAGRALAQATGASPSIVPRLVRSSLFGDIAVYRSLVTGKASIPIFPHNLLGKTFVYDPATGDYVVDETLSGAPANGVRFLLYRLDPETEQPALPLEVTGFLDIMDQSGAASTRLAIRAVDTTGGAETTLLDYFLDGFFTVSGTELSVSFSSAGFISDGSTRVEFDLQQTLSATDGVSTVHASVAHRITIPTSGISLDLALEGDIAGAPTDEIRFTFTVNDGDNVAVLAVTASQTSLDGSLAYNGEEVVQIGGSPDAPSFTRTDGAPLSEGDIQALQDIFGAVDGVLNFADDLFGPLAELFGIDQSS